MARVSVVGAGDVGLVTAACLAELGHDVVCIEKEAKRLRTLRHLQVPFYEPGLVELVERHYATGQLSFTNHYSTDVVEMEERS
jgi:UDPglucose 6-dehydrogenase